MADSAAPQSPAPRCGRGFFARGSEELAQKLLGQRLVRVLETGERLAGTIVETEAYLGHEDRAAHSFGGRRTPRNESMYGPPGTAYVYFTYGMHFCFNVVCGRVDEPVAVLIRALEPTEGLATMRRLRGFEPAGGPPGVKTGVKMGKARADTLLCSGPARLCQALGIDRRLNGIDLTADTRLWIEQARRGTVPEALITRTARIGVDYAAEWAAKPLRWYLTRSAHVSGRR